MNDISTHVVRTFTIKINRLISAITPMGLINKIPFVTVSIHINPLYDEVTVYIIPDTVNAVAFAQAIELEVPITSLTTNILDAKMDEIIQDYLDTLSIAIRIYSHPRLAAEISSDDYPSAEMAKDIVIYLLSTVDDDIDTALYGKMLMSLNSNLVNRLTRFEYKDGGLSLVLANSRIQVDGFVTVDEAIEWFINAVKTKSGSLGEELYVIHSRRAYPSYRHVSCNKPVENTSPPVLKLVSNKESDNDIIAP